MAICIRNALCDNEDMKLSTNPRGISGAFVFLCLWFLSIIDEMKRKISSKFESTHSIKVNMFSSSILHPLLSPLLYSRFTLNRNMHHSTAGMHTQSWYEVRKNTHITIATCALVVYTSLFSPVSGNVLLPSLCDLNNISPASKNAHDGPLWHALFARENLDRRPPALALICNPTIGAAATVTNALYNCLSECVCACVRTCLCVREWEKVWLMSAEWYLYIRGPLVV